MKIIDFDAQGNLVRFYLGDLDDNEYTGDDWDDRPYEHNAGRVYDEYIKGHCDVVFPYDVVVLQPSDDFDNHGNSAWCKDDMKARHVPCIAAIAVDRDSMNRWRWEDSFNAVAVSDKSFKFYFGDELDPSDEVVVFELEYDE